MTPIRVFSFNLAEMAEYSVVPADFEQYGAVSGADPIELRIPLGEDGPLLDWLPVPPCGVGLEEAP